MMETGRADAVSNDDVLLMACGQMPRRRTIFVLPDPLSSEPYGLMVRRDDTAFKDAVNSALAAMFKVAKPRASTKMVRAADPAQSLNARNFPLSAAVARAYASAQPQEIED